MQLDPEVRHQIEATYKKRIDALNKQDAAAVAALYTQDAVVVSAAGSGDAVTSGQEAIQKWYEGQLSSVLPLVTLEFLRCIRLVITKYAQSLNTFGYATCFCTR
jgi:hypothetical protein